MTEGPSPLERALEFVLSGGLLMSAALLLTGLAVGREDILRAGTLLLILTPIARVVVLTAGLFRDRDWPFALVSLTVLGVLASSAWLAWMER